MCQRRIVDRQGLDHLLSGQCSPLSEFLQVLELTDTEAVFRPQTEHRNSHTCATESRQRAAERTIVHAQSRTLLRQSPSMAVLTPLHVCQVTRSQIVDNIFVLKPIYAFHLNVCLPYGEIGIAHWQELRCIPFAELLDASHYAHALRRQYLRQVNGKSHIAGLWTPLGFRSSRCVARKQRLQERGRIERFLVIHCLPEVAHHNFLVRGADGDLPVKPCLVNETAFLQTDRVLVHNRSRRLNLRGRRPEVFTLAG